MRCEEHHFRPPDGCDTLSVFARSEATKQSTCRIPGRHNCRRNSTPGSPRAGTLERRYRTEKIKEVKLRAKIGQFGRSMVEMLGVLAIIGVLSVGAIAGYSTAMTKYKINKVVYQFTFIINSFLEHYEDISREVLADKGSSSGSHRPILPYLTALNSLPDGIQIKSDIVVVDASGHECVVFMRDHLVFDYYLHNSDSTSFNASLCSALMMNLLQPSHDILNVVWMYRGSAVAGSSWYGDKQCTAGKKCLRDITINEIDSMCHECLEGHNCTLTFEI